MRNAHGLGPLMTLLNGALTTPCADVKLKMDLMTHHRPLLPRLHQISIQRSLPRLMELTLSCMSNILPTGQVLLLLMAKSLASIITTGCIFQQLLSSILPSISSQIYWVDQSSLMSISAKVVAGASQLSMPLSCLQRRIQTILSSIVMQPQSAAICAQSSTLWKPTSMPGDRLLTSAITTVATLTVTTMACALLMSYLTTQGLIMAQISLKSTPISHSTYDKTSTSQMVPILGTRPT